jgi:hypothetical protein
VPVDVAWKTPQVWFLWGVLCMNVTAGIAVLAIASPMIQEIFKGGVTVSAAAGFTSLLSLFNIGGRIFWASLSDRIGRKTTYTIFFALGMLLYAAAPTAGRSGSLALFVAIYCVILTMYGGGFATIPAYRRLSASQRQRVRTAADGVVDCRHHRSRARERLREASSPRHGRVGRLHVRYILVALLGAGLICPGGKGRSRASLPLRRRRPARAGGATRRSSGEWGLVALGWLLAGSRSLGSLQDARWSVNVSVLNG